MPRKLSKVRRIARMTAVAAVTLSAIPAAATAACSTAPTSQEFAQWGDARYYYLAPGGDFEGSIKWTQSGAVSLAAVNNPFNLAGLGHLTSARLQSGGSVRTAKLCVSRDEPYLRFLAKSAGSGQLDLTVRVYDKAGNVTDTSSGSVSPSDHGSWRPSGLIDLKTDSLAVGENGYVDVKFQSQGDWLIDDVFIDPFRR